MAKLLFFTHPDRLNIIKLSLHVKRHTPHHIVARNTPWNIYTVIVWQHLYRPFVKVNPKIEPAIIPVTEKYHLDI